MTSVLIIFEMTGSYGLILPLMIANMTAYGLARRWRPTPIYEALLVQDGVHLPHPHGAVKHALEVLRVAEAMSRDAVTLPQDMTVEESLGHVGGLDFTAYPVADGGRYVGLVSEARLRRTLAEGGGRRPVRELAERGDHVHPDQPLVRAVVRMNHTGARQLAVVSRGDERLLVGILTMSDVVRAQARAALDAGEVERTVTPDFKGAEPLTKD
jgi:CIC family chloride channel protein